MKSTDNMKKYLKSKGIAFKDFIESAKLSQGYLNSTKDFSADILRNIVELYPDLDIEWLITGKGEMLKGTKDEKVGIPFYDNLPVTAGEGEIEPTEEVPTGYINIPGVRGKYCFPVTGCSMEPSIYPGDIVVVDNVDVWENLDPDRVYMIVTHDRRMIKHLENDPNDEELLWCVSPNYHKIPLLKSDVKFIYKVVHKFTRKEI